MSEEQGAPEASDPGAAEDARPLPMTLSEYLDVWCADLLEPLTERQRFELKNRVAIMYVGGPWPDRLSIQRDVETVTGVIAHDAALGEFTLTYSSIAQQIEHLEDPSRRDRALEYLGSFQGTPGLVTAVEDAHARGLLSEIEKAMVLDAALSQPFLPDPIPLPQHLRPLPADWPESHAEWLLRDPPYEDAPLVSPQLGAETRRLSKLRDRGEIDGNEFEQLYHQAWLAERDGADDASAGDEGPTDG